MLLAIFLRFLILLGVALHVRCPVGGRTLVPRPRPLRHPPPLAIFSEPKGPGGCSSVGRALAWHARGQGFKSPQLHSHPNRRSPRFLRFGEIPWLVPLT